MLIDLPFAYGSHQVRSLYVIDVNMILHTVFTMIVDYSETVPRQHRKEGRVNSNTVIVVCKTRLLP